MAYTAENRPYKTEPDADANANSEKALNSDSQDSVSNNGPAAYQGGSRKSYTSGPKINEHSYGQDGGKASFNNPPSVVVGGSSEAVAPPAMPGTLRIGEDKNVSTPVSG